MIAPCPPYSCDHSRAVPRRGFNLIEAAIVLGVVGLVIGGIWVAASALSNSLKVDKTLKQIIHVVTKAQALIPASMASSTGTWILIDLLNTGIASSDMLGTHSLGGWGVTPGIVNEFGGSYSLSLTPYDNGYNSPNGSIGLYMTNIPKDACIKIMTRISANTNSSSPFLLNAGNAAGLNRTSSFPIPPTTPICQNSSNNVYLMFSFARNN